VTYRTVKFRFETVLELNDGVSTPVEVSGYANLMTDPSYKADADGNRSEIRSEVEEVTIVCIWAMFPERPDILLAGTPAKVERLLTRQEMDRLIEDACERIFLDTGCEPWGDSI